jgi:DNA-binding NarL/FixJ family response regulator
VHQEQRARILIVDDHPLVRRAFRDMIEAQPDLAVHGEAAGAAEAIDAIRQDEPDLAIVDISLSEGSGLELIKCIRAQAPGVRILVVSMHDESLFAQRALQAGALGYVNKSESEERFLFAIREALRGRVALSGPIAQRILKSSVGGTRGDPRDAFHRLSDREVEVLELLGQGLPTRRVAEQLHLSVKTIETYREKLKSKLGLRDGAALARFAAVWHYEQSQGAAPPTPPPGG